MGVRTGSVVLRAGAFAAAVALAATACGSSKSTSAGGGVAGENKNTVNSATVKTGGKMTYTIEKTVQGWNPNSSSGNTFDYVQTVNGIYPSVYIPQPDFSLKLNPDLINGEPTFTAASPAPGASGSTSRSRKQGETPQTVVYHIQPKAVWSDGVPITADDFVYAWQAQNGTNPNVDAASTTGYEDIAAVTGSDNGKTFTTTYKPGKSYAEFKSLFTNIAPAHIAKQHGDLATSWTWFNDNPPQVSGGPFLIKSVSADKSLVTEVRNDKYYGPPAKLDELDFRAITDATQEPTALANGEVDAIYPQPQLDLVNRVKAISGVSYRINQGLLFEHIDLNLRNGALGGPNPGDQTQPAKEALRQAMFTSFDRQGLLNRTIKQFATNSVLLNSRVMVPGQAGYQDNVAKFGLGTGDLAKAKDILTKAGYTGVGTALVDPTGKPVPAFSMRYTVGNKLRQDTCNLFAQGMKQLGITVNVSATDSLNKTLNNVDAQHQYDIIVFAWVLTPFPASAAQPLYTTAKLGAPQGNYGYYSNPTVDQKLAAAVGQTNASQLQADLNDADQQISKDAYTLPLYQKPTMIVWKNTIGNLRDNATAYGPTYNVQDWGFKS